MLKISYSKSENLLYVSATINIYFLPEEKETRKQYIVGDPKHNHPLSTHDADYDDALTQIRKKKKEKKKHPGLPVLYTSSHPLQSASS